MPITPVRPITLGVVKLTSCDGCQLALLGLGSLLLELGSRFEIIEFAEASSARSAGPSDVLLVEGSISTPEQARHIRDLRGRCGTLVAIGACAVTGGIQALRGWATDDIAGGVYPDPRALEVLATATPVSDHVAVDAELRGCPIDASQLVELLTAVSTGRRPQLPDEAVCAECKRLGYACVVVAHGEPCLGPITRAGCGALCPAYARGCYGCFGPLGRPNVAGLTADLSKRGLDEPGIARLLAGFNAWAPPLREAISQRGGPPGFPNEAPPQAGGSQP